MSKKTAIILCGGFATRLGTMANDTPKALMKIYGKPILWYAINRLVQFGFEQIILPLGYKGEKIRAFIDEQPPEVRDRVLMVETGLNSAIGERLYHIRKHLPSDGSFFLLNGDTYFDFDVAGMGSLHDKNKVLATFAVGHVTSPYGLIVERDGKPIEFQRDSEVIDVAVSPSARGPNLVGHIYTGFAWLRTKALSLIDLKVAHNFEATLYSEILRREQAQTYKIGTRWFPIDTAKDLSAINSNDWVLRNIQLRHTGRDLKSRYSYQSRYFSDADLLKEQILNKTVIPHQLEVQPGPTSLKSLCWMKCPYCYGLSSEDSGERLSPDRYEEVLKQAAAGGVKKFIFAGYATDPLNYKFIDRLHHVALETGAIFGFHTKAIKISDQLINQITSPNIAPQSYFSVSVDSGTNESYNKVHGVDSTAKVYDRVIQNITHIAEARSREASVLDLSATYLVNDLNNSTEEVEKAIHDLRNSGVDLIRFTFPQVPRGFDEENNSPFVPSRDSVLSYMERLKPVIERENSDTCQVIIMDLDDEFSIVDKARTLPCFARFLFPSIGFDGYLAHCSESAAPHFREMSIANLETTDFWDAFYNYPAEEISDYLKDSARTMNKTGCRCDRKEHVVNQALSGVRF